MEVKGINAKKNNEEEKMKGETMEKIKIAYLVSTLNRTGPINILYGIIKNLDSNKFEIYIITLSPSNKNSMEKLFEDFGCEIINLNFSRVEGLFKYKKEIEKILKDKKIEILHSHCFRADYYNSVINIRGLKKISTIHNYPYEDYVMSYGNIFGRIMAYFSIKFLKKIKNPIACSKTLKEKWGRFLKLEYIQNGIDISKYMPPTTEEKIILRKKLELLLDKKIFIVSGVISKRKNPFTIIKAFEKIDLPNSILIFIGEGELYQDCLKESSKCENIIFEGRIENVSEYLKIADYYISASFSEGLPNSVLEAMATGLPCLLSNIPSHKEIISNDKYLFNPNCYQELADKMKLIEKENYEILSENSRRIVQDNFSDKLMSKKYIEYYKGEN